jgi:hypothetical protein
MINMLGLTLCLLSLRVDRFGRRDEKFAEEVIEECASFPYGDHDDLVDSMTQAVMRFRQGGFIGHPEDEKDEVSIPHNRTYY